MKFLVSYCIGSSVMETALVSGFVAGKLYALEASKELFAVETELVLLNVGDRILLESCSTCHVYSLKIERVA